MNKLFGALFFILFSLSAYAQNPPLNNRDLLRGSSQNESDTLSYLNPKDFLVGNVTISGAKYLDKAVLLQITKLNRGDKISVPGEATSNAIKNLWQQGLFDDVDMEYALRGDTIDLNFNITERPRLSRLNLLGLRSGQRDEVNKKLTDKVGKIVNENLKTTTSNIIKKHFQEKGYLNTTVTMTERRDSSEQNNVFLDVLVDKKTKVKINSITFTGNKEFKAAKLKKFMKKTREKKFYNLFGSKKFMRDKYTEDKQLLVQKMQAKGYRDAQILNDTVTRHDDNTVDIKIDLHEGPKYYFGNITFAGNAKYLTDDLMKILKINKGDVFSEEELEKRLEGPSQTGETIHDLYLNTGHLTSSVDPVQTRIYNDTVDLDIRIHEGPQFDVNRIVLKGNELTNDRVVLREIRTKPGDKFSKDAIVRSTREIANLGNFDEAKTNPRPININEAEGTVDIEYDVTEKPSDQIELSGGFGAGQFVGTVGLTFNNFSIRNLFKIKEYRPLPKGDGQKFSIRGQASGAAYQSFSLTFSEPWFGGKKPMNFGVSAFFTNQSNAYFLRRSNPNYLDDPISANQLVKIKTYGITTSLSRRLKWPDDYFYASNAINLQLYDIVNYPAFLIQSGRSYNFALTQEFSRNSIDQPLFPTSGSNIRLTIQATPPYSLLNNTNYNIATPTERYKFAEYHKWKFEGQWFEKIYGKLVLKAQTQFGFLGYYNKAVGQSPFERFVLGGSGMQNFQRIQGVEIIGLRGYSDYGVIPDGADFNTASQSGSPIFAKYTLELRHPVTTSQSATVFILGFAEGGNTWNRFRDFSPFNVRRSAGVGARIFLPIFGLLGLDYGYAFDRIPGVPDSGRQPFTFSISQSLNGGFN
ncbi:MAG: outer membrane protein assembly factor BamA [Mucilaginibacter polytrichastri]|nr:outer membrane protein assembly factor BamA [Mucilaginibacter polytrichastri]